MIRPSRNEDDTVLLGPGTRPPVRGRWRRPGGIAAAVVVALGLAVGLGVLLRPAPVPTAPAPPLLDEAALLARRTDRLLLGRWAPDPAVLVLDFPTLAEQGRMLNRVAALVEKRGEPRGRVLSDAELAAAIGAAGATPETYYYGHDYGAPELLRFFALADRDHVALDADEERLRGLLRDAGWFAPGANGALISMPQPVAPVDAHTRAVILHHELSHGEFFTRPAYADWTRRFWREQMHGDERARVRDWLASEGYDPGEEELMMNEAQAYLVWTPDPAFFAPAMVGLEPARAAELRRVFLAGRPPDGRDEGE